MRNQIRIQTLTNSQITFKQCIRMYFRLEGTFYVTNKDFGGKYQLLMGYDFLKENHMILDFEEKCLKFKGETIALNI